MAYVAEVGTPFETKYDRTDARLRLIYDNGTESDLLLRSLQRALYKDDAGRRVSDPDAGPLFGENKGAGRIYVLRSQSDHPTIAQARSMIHKIGVTGGAVERRIANADREPTYLMAPVTIAGEFEVFNINPASVENLLHRFFAEARLDITIPDRFGQNFTPREWFVVPLGVIEEVVGLIGKNELHRFRYDPADLKLVGVTQNQAED